MTIALHTASGIFTKLGHIIQAMNDANALRGGSLTVDGAASDVSATMKTKVNNIEADFAASTAQYNIVDGIQSAYASFQGAQSSWISYLKTLAQNCLIDMADSDQKLPAKTVTEALKLLIIQMAGATKSVKANVPALGSQTSVGSPTGSPGIVGTVKNGKGTYSGKEYAIAETIAFICTKDAQSGGGTANGETFSVTGQNAQTDKLSWDWPKGSGKSITLTVTDPQLSNQATGNVLQNSGFDTFDSGHANQPDNWVKVVGTAGTDYGKETSTVFGNSAAALKLTGNAGGSAVLVNLTQAFNTAVSTSLDAGGTPYNIAANPETNYILSFWIKADVVPAAGVLTVDLVDGTPSVIADTGGTNNTTAITLSGISTSYVQKTAVFRLPASAPTTIKLRVRVTTAISTGSIIYIDDMALTKATALYAAGPEFAIFRGAAKPLVNDQYTMALTISAAGALQRGMQKLFDIDTLGLYIPSLANGSETESDTLIA